jgi:LacI family transcriptional regulator
MARPKEKNGMPTLKSIAERTGYTANTVSQALRNSSSVAQETRDQIRKVAREMGYVHNVVASSLRSGRTHTVALVFGDVSNMLFAIKIRELEEEFRKHGYQVLILNTDEDPELERRAIHTAISRQVDGVVLCPCQKGREALTLMEQHRVPYVLSGRYFEDEACDSVVWADYKGGLIATRHLIARGCRRILFLNGPEMISSARERGRGYRDALEAAGLTPVERSVPSSMAGGVRRALDDLDRQGLRYDGIFAFSDLMALEAACWLIEHGKRIPEDVRMAGFDDILSHMCIPFGLTSISADKRQETLYAVELLLGRIEGQTQRLAERRTMDVELVARTSS